MFTISERFPDGARPEIRISRRLASGWLASGNHREMRITTASAHPYRRRQKLPDIGQKVSGIESRKIFLVDFEKMNFLIVPIK